MEDYHPQDFWEEQLNEDFNLEGVGNTNFNRFYNKWLYRNKISSFETLLGKHDISLEGKRILDVGCGTGFWIKTLRERAHSILGVDIAQESIDKLAQEFPQQEFKKVDFGKKGVDLKEKFDFITMFDVVYHNIEEERFDNIFENVSNHLKEGGKCIFTGHFQDEPHEPANHVKARPLSRYKEVFEKNNLQIMDVQPLYFLMNRAFSQEYGNILAKILNFLAPFLYFTDQFLRETNLMNGNGNNIKIMIIRKESS